MKSCWDRFSWCETSDIICECYWNWTIMKFFFAKLLSSKLNNWLYKAEFRKAINHCTDLVLMTMSGGRQEKKKMHNSVVIQNWWIYSKLFIAGYSVFTVFLRLILNSKAKCSFLIASSSHLFDHVGLIPIKKIHLLKKTIIFVIVIKNIVGNK